MAMRITVHFQSWAKWLMALVLKYCHPCWAQQYSDIPCNVVGFPSLSTILFPFTLSRPCFWTKVSSASTDEASARQAHAKAAIRASRVAAGPRELMLWIVFIFFGTAFRRWFSVGCSLLVFHGFLGVLSVCRARPRDESRCYGIGPDCGGPATRQRPRGGVAWHNAKATSKGSRRKCRRCRR